jgi:hypothetical protein
MRSDVEAGSRPPNDPSSASLHDGSAGVRDLDARLADMEAELSQAHRAAELALELVAEQERRLAQVRALVDLAEWASSQDAPGALEEPAIRASDLRRALQ